MHRLPFGTHKGLTLAEAPPDYVVWLAGTDKVPSVWRELAQRHLGLGPVETGPAPEPGSPAVLFPRIVFTWWDSMRGDFAGDPAALKVIDRGLAHLKDLCAAVTGRRWPTEAELSDAREDLDREERERGRT